jgi:hypothetical protein
VKLTKIDPGGKLSNRPLSSLRNIFSILLPQTAADINTRLKVIDTIRAKEPEIAWRLLIELLPKIQSIGQYTLKPRWHDWASDTPSLSPKEYVENLNEIVSRLFARARERYRFSALIKLN